MIRAYSQIYLEKAQTALGSMLDYAVNDLQYDLTGFFGIFLTSGVASLFGSGDVQTIAGRSGIELAWDVLEKSGMRFSYVTPQPRFDRTPEYWAGWALAYYQWSTAFSFRDIVRCVPITDIVAMYNPYHEMDIRQFCDNMTKLIREAQPETNLKRIRQIAGLSQNQLAQSSGVPVRTIQQYEQRQKNINKAQAEYIFMMASALGCQPEALIEHCWNGM
jgi:DNA-binding transcriptional regulator YiaG